VSIPIADPHAEEAFADPHASAWLKRALEDSFKRDPVDALNDALALAGVLEERLRRVFELDDKG